MTARPATAVLLFFCWTHCGPRPAAADLGPENAVLVVNVDSLAARTVANHYAALRGVPASHVVAVRDLPDWERLTADQFRELLLEPVLETVNAAGLAAQTDVILYSPAVPTAIDLRADVAKLDAAPNKIFTPVGSVTGLTTLYRATLAGRADAVLFPAANAYFAAAGGDEPPETVGFRSTVGFDERGERVPGGGRRFLLSTALGVSTGYGESLAGIVARLRTTAAADGTDPAGDVVFTETGDVRVTARKAGFAAAVGAIDAAAEARGIDVRARVVSGDLPRGLSRVVGLTCGAARPNWRAGGSRFAPGAFADNLTSFGGVMTVAGRGLQTTAADWLRSGAAAAGGTVTEPYALAFKFPSPFVHLHRVRGATLAEAVGLSVAGPYQYLTLGDGLSAPYARRPRVTLAVPEGPVSGRVTLDAAAKMADGTPADVAGWEVFADGRRVAAFPAGAPVTLDAAALGEGVHEITAAATLAGPLQARGRATRAVRVGTTGRRAAARVDGGETVWGEPLAVRVAAAGFGEAEEVTATLRHGREVVATGVLDAKAGGHAGVLTVDTRPLGLGPVTLGVGVGAGGDGKGGEEEETGAVRGAGVRVTVLAPPYRRATVRAGARTDPGPTLAFGGTAATADFPPKPGWLGAAGVPADTPFTLTAVVKAETTGLERLAVRSNCGVRVAVGGEPAPAVTGETARSRAGAAWRSVPLWLAAGTHEVVLTGRTPAKGAAVLRLTTGRRGQAEPAAGAWRHAR